MSKFIDIIPPKPKKTVHHESKKNSDLIFLVILIVFLAIIVFITIKVFIGNTAAPNLENDIPETQISTRKSDPLVTPQPPATSQAVTVKNQIRLINASGKTDLVGQAVKLLTAGDYKIEQTGSTSAYYDETKIYYRRGQIDEAKKIQQILTVLKPVIQESGTLGDSYNFLIVLGQNI